jgi:hypothetical protein
MIIPISTQNLNIGDTVITTREYKNEYYIITIGHEFKIIDYNKAYSRFVCEDENKLIVEFYDSFITKKVSIEQANNEYIFAKETNEYKNYILKKCPHKGEGYDDRDIYDTCDLKTNYYKPCEVNIDCAKHLSKDDISKSVVLLKHLRLNKIKKINK